MVRISSVLVMCTIYVQLSEQIYSGDSYAAVFKNKVASGTRFYNESVPEECQKLGICESSEHYPEELAMELMREFNKSNIVLDTDVNDQMGSNFGNTLSFRFNDPQRNPCKYVTKKIVPLRVKYMDDKWYYVLNDRYNPIQVYKVQICSAKSSIKNRNSQCTSIILHNDFESQCIQKNITRTVVVIDEATRNLFSIPVVMPCCCACVAIESNK